MKMELSVLSIDKDYTWEASTCITYWIILSGSGTLYIDEQEYALGPFEAMRMPVSDLIVAHRTFNHITRQEAQLIVKTFFLGLEVEISH